jgi:hypothetical protein
VKSFYPEYEDLGDGKELMAGVGYLARLRNPFKTDRTLTICNGIFSRGVFGRSALPDQCQRSGRERTISGENDQSYRRTDDECGCPEEREPASG